jgi:hypothetical protein
MDQKVDPKAMTSGRSMTTNFGLLTTTATAGRDKFDLE